MAQPVLWIGRIGKNEIRCLEKCLKALQPLREAIPCELVIADTGSDDGTREVAARYADILFDFAWVNDFSAARNAVMDRCTGRWFLAVDADEYLDPDFKQLTEFLTGPEADQYSLAFVNQYSYQDIKMEEEGMDFLALRMARMDSHPRYSGSIHESLPVRTSDRAKILMDVKLHHDGYAIDPKHPEAHTRKMERNLALLENELKKSPNELRRVLQCIESSGPFPGRKIGYIRHAMKLLTQKKGLPEENIYGPIICDHALRVAVDQKMPELEKWQAWAMKKYPTNMFLRVDGNLSMVRYYREKKQYEKVPEFAKAFLSAWQDYHNRNFDVSVLAHSILSCTARKFEVYVRAADGEALGHIGKTSEAAAVLAAEPDWEGLNRAEVYALLEGCVWAAQEPSLQEFVASGAAITRKREMDIWDGFLAAAEAAFKPHEPGEEAPDRPWRLYARVEGSLGRAAALMDAEDEAALQQYLPWITDWKEVPAPAVARVIELGGELPSAFYRQNREQLQTLAVKLCELLKPQVVLDWMTRSDFSATMVSFQFYCNLLMAMLQADKTWEGNGEWRASLCDRFLDAEADYMSNYYNRELLQDEAEWPALPGMHRFALCLLRGREAQEAGDSTAYMRLLRQGLSQAPKMKKMVQFLLDETGFTKVSGVENPATRLEIAAMAEKVQAILAKYAPDDPAVIALKQSELYKKALGLIETKKAEDNCISYPSEESHHK